MTSDKRTSQEKWNSLSVEDQNELVALWDEALRISYLKLSLKIKLSVECDDPQFASIFGEIKDYPLEEEIQTCWTDGDRGNLYLKQGEFSPLYDLLGRFTEAYNKLVKDLCDKAESWERKTGVSWNIYWLTKG